MRKDIYYEVERIKAMGIKLNYSELARKYNCDPRTVKNYSSGTKKEMRKTTEKQSKIDKFKSTIEEKVDNCCATAMSIFKFIEG